MKDYPVDDADDTLIHATLARIDRYEQESAARMMFDARQNAAAIGEGERGARRIRLPDFITVAAVLLIGASVLWPLLTSMRQRSIDLACSNNLKRLGYAFADYAADFNDAMPLAQAGLGGWSPSTRNAINLQPLIEYGYCDHGHLNCPGHVHEVGPSYSYRWFVQGAPVHWNVGKRVTVVLGDLNPMIEAARSGSVIPPLSISVNHAGRGQNVLVSDGATMWLEQPLVGRRDNIWLPEGTESLRQGALPHNSDDVFLAH